MALDPEDVQALDARIEASGRVVFAGALRMQASSLRTQADLAAAMARTLDAQAEAIEDGREPLPQQPVRMAVVPDAPEEEVVEPERDPLLVMPVKLGSYGTSDAVLLPRDVDEFTPAMLEFLGLFDDRLRMSPHFVQAVNEAADEPWLTGRDAARWVQSRVYDLRDAAAVREAGGEGGK